jgi:Na+/melibiose symporter-like transporter
MSLTRLRSGELLATLGAVLLVVGSFLPWYESAGAQPSSWGRFGIVTVLIVIAASLALLLAVATVAERSPALPVAGAVWTTLWGAIAAIGVLSVVLGHTSALCVGSWLSLLAALAIAAGGWQSMRDERTERYEPAQPSPRPPPV